MKAAVAEGSFVDKAPGVKVCRAMSNFLHGLVGTLCTKKECMILVDQNSSLQFEKHGDCEEEYVPGLVQLYVIELLDLKVNMTGKTWR